jgi:hypothetical protein
VAVVSSIPDPQRLVDFEATQQPEWSSPFDPLRAAAPSSPSSYVAELKPPDGIVPAPLGVDAEPTPPPTIRRSGTLTRLFAAGTLLALVAGLGYVGHGAYRAMTDAFIAPMILSPESDVVMEQRAKLTQLEVERARAAAEAEGVDAELARIEKGMARLGELEAMAKNALEWTRRMTKHEASANSVEFGVLDGQTATLNRMIAKQRQITARAQKNLEAGIITGPELEKAEQALSQMELALLEIGRTSAQAQVSMSRLHLAEASLAGKNAAAPMPAVVAAEDLLVRVELEMFRLDAEKRAKSAEKKSIDDRIAKLDDLEAQFKSRPLFQAIEKNLDIAFVPYTQLDRLGRGATVWDCKLAFFACRNVGMVAEVVPGEVTSPDPWGTPARGQYTVLELREHDAAKSKALRARLSTPLPLGAVPSSITQRYRTGPGAG